MANPRQPQVVAYLCHTWYTDSAVHRGEGARCGSAPRAGSVAYTARSGRRRWRSAACPSRSSRPPGRRRRGAAAAGTEAPAPHMVHQVSSAPCGRCTVWECTVCGPVRHVVLPSDHDRMDGRAIPPSHAPCKPGRTRGRVARCRRVARAGDGGGRGATTGPLALLKRLEREGGREGACERRHVPGIAPGVVPERCTCNAATDTVFRKVHQSLGPHTTRGPRRGAVFAVNIGDRLFLCGSACIHS